MTKETLTYMVIGLAYMGLILGSFVAAIWTRDMRWGATGVLLILPSVLIVALGKKEPNE